MSCKLDDAISLESTDEESWDANEEFQVERILDEQEHDGKKVYLVKWEGYDHLANTWEPRESFQNEVALSEWERHKKRVELGVDEPFDVEAWTAKIERSKKNKADRKARRAAKRLRLGVAGRTGAQPEKNRPGEAELVDIERDDPQDVDYGPDMTEPSSQSSPYASADETASASRSRGRRAQQVIDSDDEDDLPLVKRKDTQHVLRKTAKQLPQERLSSITAAKAPTVKQTKTFTIKPSALPLKQVRSDAPIGTKSGTATSKRAPANRSNVPEGPAKHIDTIKRSPLGQPAIHMSPESQYIVGTASNNSLAASGQGSRTSIRDQRDGENSIDKTPMTKASTQAPLIRPSNMTATPKNTQLASEPHIPSTNFAAPKLVMSGSWEDAPVPKVSAASPQSEDPLKILSTQAAAIAESPGSAPKQSAFVQPVVNLLNQTDPVDIHQPAGIRSDSGNPKRRDSNKSLGLYKTLSRRRKAELEGRSEPPPDPEGLVLVPLGSKMPKANTVLSPRLTRRDPPSRSEALSMEGQAGSNEDFLLQSSDSASCLATTTEQESTTGGSERMIGSKEKRARGDDFGSDFEKDQTDGLQGISATRHFPAPVALPLSRLYGNAGDATVKGHLVFCNTLAAANFTQVSDVLRYLMLKIKRPPNLVHFDLSHICTNTDYERVLHSSGSLYFGAGSIEPRYDPEALVEQSNDAICQLASALRIRWAGALFACEHFIMVVWPTNQPGWKFLDSIYPPVKSEALLRFIIRKPIQPLSIQQAPSASFPMSTVKLEGNRAKETSFLNHILSIDWSSIVKHGKQHVAHVFLLYPPEQRPVHDILLVFIRCLGVQAWTSLVPGHWKAFCEKVIGSNPRLKELSEHAAMLAHTSFRKYPIISGLGRLLRKGLQLYTIDIRQNGAKQMTMSGELPNQHQMIQEYRVDSHVHILSSAPDLGSWNVTYTYIMPPRKIVAELFPVNKGRAILLLDSFFVMDPNGVERFLGWFLFPENKRQLQHWRLVVRPHLHGWLKAVAKDLIRRSDQASKEKAKAWVRVFKLVNELVPSDQLDEKYDFEIADWRTYPMIISYPRRVCPAVDWTYPLGNKRADEALRRKNDKALFDWFGQWSVQELRAFRDFDAISGETSMSKMNEYQISWPADWQYIRLWHWSEYQANSHIDEWARRNRERRESQEGSSKLF